MITLKSGRKIGPGQPPYIVAEVGSNWRTLDDCKLSIAMAKRAGADGVKFQAYTRKALYGLDAFTVLNADVAAAHGIKSGRREDVRAYVEGHGPLPASMTIPGVDATVEEAWREPPGVLPLDWLPILAEKARVTGIDFLCTAFSPELVDAVDRHGHVAMHKVASAELSHVRLLERIRATGKPVLLSTGASTPGDIAQALRVLDGVPVVLLYCVAAYPATDIDFRHIGQLASMFRLPVGYSDHSTDSLVIPHQAVQWGACVLEKHFTAIDSDTPDRPHSLTASQFKRMVDNIHGRLAFAWGSGEENEMRTKHNRRLICTHPVRAGEPLAEGKNFGIYRSLREDVRGLTPFAIGSVHGRAATRAIAPGEAIGPGDYQ